MSTPRSTRMTSGFRSFQLATSTSLRTVQQQAPPGGTRLPGPPRLTRGEGAANLAAHEPCELSGTLPDLTVLTSLTAQDLSYSAEDALVVMQEWLQTARHRTSRIRHSNSCNSRLTLILGLLRYLFVRSAAARSFQGTQRFSMVCTLC